MNAPALAPKVCKEPGCGELVTDAFKYGARCPTCWGLDECENTNCRNQAALGRLCRVCASRERPGQVFFLNRWRPLPEAVERVMGDRVYRRVTWTQEGDLMIGRDGTFEIRLRLTMRLPA